MVEDSIEAMTARIRGYALLPIGFGVSTPEQAKIVVGFGDAVVAGSALVNQIAEQGKSPDLVKRVTWFVKALADAVKLT